MVFLLLTMIHFRFKEPILKKLMRNMRWIARDEAQLSLQFHGARFKEAQHK